MNNTLRILGKDYRVKINYKNIDLTELTVGKSEIQINLSNKLKGKNHAKIITLAIGKLYKNLAIREIERAMEKMRILLGYAPEDYKIARMENNYGKCVKNIITINPEVVQFKRETIDRIVLEQYLKLKLNTRHIRNRTKIAA